METQMKLNVTARAARWSAAHWKTATFTWLALVVAAVTAGTMLGAVNLTNSENGTGESARAQAILSSSGFKHPSGESVLVQSKTHRVATDPVFATTLATVVTRLKAQPQVTNVRRTQTSKDGRSVLVEFDLRGDAETADARVQPVLETVAALQRAAPGYTIAEFGNASVNHQISEAIGKDVANAEKLSLPITFLILLIVSLIWWLTLAFPNSAIV
jgi:RND superfamily putative drug exporter